MAPEHMILFPFMAQGHIFPFMALARVLEQRTGYTITFVNTPLNVQAARAAFPSTTAIRFAELPFDSSDHGLPPSTENTDGLPYSLVCALMEASLTLRPAFERLVSCIISLPKKKKDNVLCASSLIFSSDGRSTSPRAWASFTPCSPSMPSVWPSISPSGFASLTTTRPIPTRFVSPTSRCRFPSTALSSRTIWLPPMRKDGGGEGLDYWVSSMLHNEVRSRKEDGVLKVMNACIEWLDQHSPASVLYICFGSMNTISASQMMEFAIGLEECRKPFIWVIRTPLGHEINGEFRSEWLPPGWAPQLEILSHESVGAFLSHCGWNSTVESLTRGVPIIGWPLSAEQFYNSKMLEEILCVSVEIARTNRSEIHRGHVAAMIEMVMGETEKGQDMRRRAVSVKEVLAAAVRDDEGSKGSSIRAVDGFLSAAIFMRKFG
ncbi:hypothetical protein H6P81_013807 [Aristolochia fimbriata]|uniref:Glycosyltransferase n=1 Tax=Aristolochia fimbriata TaxID=158543 RepID=A0AAV7EG64_ARIFI|nr:hypothetical protein H6P81_013807 [Aristolochia fimbriata]